uniref:Carbohydrate-selective porin OprB n=1 Tax=Solibacter usitatus (strain Ellin6076) TaxID=234267 RepID=Q023W3_SOLUE
MRHYILMTVMLAASAGAQSTGQRWNLYWQATSIGQYHPGFDALYSGVNSLAPHSEAEASLTSTLFLGLRFSPNTQFYFDPELAGGRGFSGVTGIADAPNGELPRVASAAPKPYVARLFVTHDFGFGADRETVEADANSLGGTRPMTRYSVTVGRFTVTDFFDNNRYSHDPRTQFMTWGTMYNGAWDYPADTRGYTWGWVHEFHTRHWSARYASVGMPRVANGLRFDRRILVNRGDVAEIELRRETSGHPGAVRTLAYLNHARAGTYRDALQMALPDVTASRRDGTRKFGFGMTADQEITKDIGVFGRLGWNDGKTESFCFTAIDRLASAGVSVIGQPWKRPHDTFATAVTVAGLSAVHAEYLARGGLDFLIGDGALTYGKEIVSETYYAAQVFSGGFVTLDLQHVTNPAYNRDRGPVWIGSLRLHLEWGKR